MDNGPHTLCGMDNTVDGVVDGRLALLRLLSRLGLKNAFDLPPFTITFFGTGVIMSIGDKKITL